MPLHKVHTIEVLKAKTLVHLKMEKLSEIKSKFLKFLPKKLVASVAFQNPIVSPCRSPTRFVSIIPKEARRKHKGGISFSAKEPTSPKVTCIGQVQCKKKKKAQKHKRVQQPPMMNKSGPVSCPEKTEKILLWISSKGNCEGPKQSGKAFVLEEKASAIVTAPSLGTMKKFASGRGSLCDFDVTLAKG